MSGIVIVVRIYHCHKPIEGRFVFEARYSCHVAFVTPRDVYIIRN
jgi:hypothetical protein